MKSIALIVWLSLPNGQSQIVQTTHFDDMATCSAAAQSTRARYAAQGGKTRHLCHVVIEENTDVDMYGNPLPKPITQ